MPKMGFEIYAKCAYVSKIAFRKLSKITVETPIRIPLLLRILFDISKSEAPIIPKIPPSEKYNSIGWEIPEH